MNTKNIGMIISSPGKKSSPQLNIHLSSFFLFWHCQHYWSQLPFFPLLCDFQSVPQLTSWLLCSFFLLISKYIICSFSKPSLQNGHLLSSPFVPLIHSKCHFWKWIFFYTAIFLLCSSLLIYFWAAYISHFTFWPILLNLSPYISLLQGIPPSRPWCSMSKI